MRDQLYRRWFEDVVSQRDVALADELLSSDYILHFPGMGVPPSGNYVTAEGVGIGRIAAGRIAESGAAYDALGLMQQVAAIPSSGG